MTRTRQLTTMALWFFSASAWPCAAAPADCRVLTPQSALVKERPELEALLEAVADGSKVEVCGKSELARFFVYEVPRGQRYGACMYRVNEVYWLRDRAYWSPYAPAGRARHSSLYLSAESPAPGACPPHADSSYVLTIGLSEGLFSRLAKFWVSVNKDPSVLNQSTVAEVVGLLNEEPYVSLRAALGEASKTGQVVRMTRVALDAELEVPKYQVDCTFGAASWQVDVDLGATGFEVTGVRTLVY